MKKQIIALSTLLVLGLSSCKKDKNDLVESKPKTKTEILTDRDWDLNYIRTTTTMADTIAFDEKEHLNGKVTFTTNKQMISNIPGEGIDTVTYELKGDSLLFEDHGFLIEELTDKKLIMANEVEAEVPQMGKYKIRMEANFSR